MIRPSVAAVGPASLPDQAERPVALHALDRAPEDSRPAAGRPSSFKAPGPLQVTPVLRAKVQPPPLRTSTLSRQRLLDRLASATQSRLTLVIADAGYGKSTLLADFSRRFDGVSLWYTLEPDDLDWLTLVPHLIAAAREVNPDFGATTASLLRAEPGISPPKSAVISSLLGELEGFHDGRVVVIFDDVHAVAETPEANELLERFVRQAPASFSFVFAGRHRPAFPVARWAGKGELDELTTDDLRFSREETARLFADSYGQALESDVLDELEARTQGWAACLQLFSTLINGLSPIAIRAAARSLSGSTGALFEYLAQEVVSKLSRPMQGFVTRAAILQAVDQSRLQALFDDAPADALEEWIAEAEALGLLSRASLTSATRQFHPLLREYLLGELARRNSADEISGFHARVARASEPSDPLTACHHYLEAGLDMEAMRCLSDSTLQTLGSGRSGTAALLATRLKGQPPTGAVAVIQARRLLEEGGIEEAANVLASIDIDAEPAPVRAALRQTSLNLAWRMGSTDEFADVLVAILSDGETPALLREIGQIFRDGSSVSERPVPIGVICQRLKRMATAQESAGYGYYAAISRHNAAIGSLYAGRLTEALDLAAEAIATYEQLSIRPAEFYSTLAVLAHASFELSRKDDAERYLSEALSAPSVHADVPAGLAYIMAVVGERDRANKFLDAADSADREGRSDISAKNMAAVADALLVLPNDPKRTLDRLSELPAAYPLDLGEADHLVVVAALAHLLCGDTATALRAAASGEDRARARGNRMAAIRLGLIRALAGGGLDDIRSAVAEAAEWSHLAIPELADAISLHLHRLDPLPDPVENSIRAYPERWLPNLRRMLALGDDPRAHSAARLLARHGNFQDVTKLRAYEKTYRRRGSVAGVGKTLARRVSPVLNIRDLGQVTVSVGEREVALSGIRRRSGAVLMYLVTRHNFTATREQVIEDLWPDGDVSSGSNSLNQSLYFLRREIDPWYEDAVSPEYVTFEGELLSLDAELTRADSVGFLRRAREVLSQRRALDAFELLGVYRGQFAPEFEYEEWALSWRSRVHAAYLDFARETVGLLARAGDLRAATDAALRVLAVDPDAMDMERALVWLYWRMGARSAAETQYAHLAATERSDGLRASTLSEIVSAPEISSTPI